MYMLFVRDEVDSQYVDHKIAEQIGIYDGLQEYISLIMIMLQIPK